MSLKKTHAMVNFDVDERKVSKVLSLAKKHVSGIDSSKCVAITATMYAPNTSRDLCYGFCFPKIKDVELGGVYKNDDGSISKIVSILDECNDTKVFQVKGYWKDGGSIDGYLIAEHEFENCSSAVLRDVGDDNIFFYGLSEEMIKDAILKGADFKEDFVISDYEIYRQ